MASQQRDRGGKTCKTWRARVKLLGVDHYLGSYATKEEAEAVEAAFRKEHHTDEYFKLKNYYISDGRTGR